MIVKAISLIFCLAGLAIITMTGIEAFIAWYSGVEYREPVAVWSREITKALIVLVATVAVAYSCLKG